MTAPRFDETSLRQLEAWLSNENDSLGDPHAAKLELEGALNELTRLHELVVRGLGAVGRRRSVPAAIQSTLVAANERRAELLREVGSRIAEWSASGGGVRLHLGANAQIAETSSRTAISPAFENDSGASSEGLSDTARASAAQAFGGRETPLTSDQIQAWLGRLREARPTAPSAPVVPIVPLTFEKQLAVLKQLMSTLDAPREREGSAEWNAEAEALVAAMSRDRIETWKQMSPSMQRAWLAMLVSRARAATDPSLGFPLIRSRVNAMFPRLSAFSKEEQPGYVHGLAVTHLPTRGTWLADAAHAWEELEQIIEGEEAIPAARTSAKAARPSEELDDDDDDDDDGPNSERESAPVAATSGESVEVAPAEAEKPRRKLATKKKVEAAPAEDAEPSSERADDDDAGGEADIEESWAGWGWTRQKRAVIFGGEVRETSRLRLEEAFEFTELAWVSVAQQRRVHSLVTRVASGTVDLVLVLQKFVNHKTASKVIDACREAGVAWAMVENGYGVSAIRRAIDHHLGATGTPLGSSPAAQKRS